jgi:hypothetical protein
MIFPGGGAEDVFKLDKILTKHELYIDKTWICCIILFMTRGNSSAKF